MNDSKFAFIFCVNNNGLFEESVKYIRNLNIPDGIEIEIIPIIGAASICSGYNQGMRRSNAKFKAYVHQDVFIINQDFIVDTIDLFKKNPKLGLLGVAGAEVIPENGVWWESKRKYGMVYDSITNRMQLNNFMDIEEEYKYVEALDGLIMVTQYDLPWKEDIFDGWHFYDLSQCQEYLAHGYEIGIPKQDTPWCIHDCGIIEIDHSFEEYRKKFLIHYMENNKKSSDDYAIKSEDYYTGLNKHILEHIDEDVKAVLEVGCAQGNLGYFIKKKYNAYVAGIEAFPNAAMEAKKKLDDLYEENIEMFKFPFNKNTFDHIIFGDVLEHLNDPWTTLLNVKPYLKNNGSIIASIPNVAHITMLLELLSGNWTYQNSGLLDKTHLRFFTKNEIKKMFYKCGYNITKIKSVTVTNENYDKLITYLYEVLGVNIKLVTDEFIERSTAYQYIVVAEKIGE